MHGKDLTTISALELLALNRQSLHELKQRGVVRTFNNPQGVRSSECVGGFIPGNQRFPVGLAGERHDAALHVH